MRYLHSCAPEADSATDDAGAYPGVVVIQAWWGIDDHIKSVVQRLTVEGFVGIAPDLYHGRVAAEPNEARKPSGAT